MFVIACAYRWQLPVRTWGTGPCSEVVVLIKLRHMLSTSCSIEVLCPGMVNRDTVKAPAVWLMLAFQACFSLLPFVSLYASLVKFLFLLIHPVLFFLSVFA